MKEKIKDIIETELNDLVKNLQDCFNEKCKNKQYNFLLGNFSNYNKANMVFVSCFESQIGNRIENICRKIVKLKYNEVPQKIPNIDTSFKLNSKKQYILTDIDYKYVTGEIYKKVDSQNKLNVKKIKTLFNDFQLNNDVQLKCDKNIKLPVDLAFYDENNELNIFEIKAGGMLDSSKAKSDLAKLLGLYIATGNINTHVYFATIYNFNGEANHWNGSPARFFEKDLLLIGKDFWNKILPPGVSFKNFVQIYNKCFTELGIKKEMNKLINKQKYRK